MRRWSELSRVERVSLYTRLSLHVALWGLCLAFVVGAVPMMDAPVAVAVVVAGAVVTALGSSTFNAVMEIYPRTRPFPWSRAAALVAGCAVYLLIVIVLVGQPARGGISALVVASLTTGLGGLPDRRVAAGLVVVSAVVGGIGGEDWFAVAAAVVVAVFVVGTVRASLWLYGIVAELDAARHTQAQLAVAEERLRFSRDVHDVLGRHLSTIAVQAELAATLAERGDERAAPQMMQVRQVAHDALTEARELARGYRPTSLPQELEGARSLLRSAGIAVRLETGAVPRGWHEAAGWVVREGVTNVLRHSSAQSVVISFADEVLRIENDGLTPAPAGDAPGLGNPGLTDAGLAGSAVTGSGVAGSGLSGLRGRLDPLGARLDAGRRDDRWIVTARLPASGPLSASAVPSAVPAPTPPVTGPPAATTPSTMTTPTAPTAPTAPTTPTSADRETP
ncbi:hypothetical protein JCM9957A_18770 [Kineosporia succinea]